MILPRLVVIDHILDQNFGSLSAHALRQSYNLVLVKRRFGVDLNGEVVGVYRGAGRMERFAKGKFCYGAVSANLFENFAEDFGIDGVARHGSTGRGRDWVGHVEWTAVNRKSLRQ